MLINVAQDVVDMDDVKVTDDKNETIESVW